MPQVALNYDTQLADLQRRQQLAQALQQQSMAPLQTTGNYKGIEAPISKYAGIDKLLQAYLGARGQRKASEGIAQLNTRAQQEVAQALQAYYQPPAAPVAPQPPQMSPQPQVGGMPPTAPAPMAAVPQPAPQPPALTSQDQMQAATGYMASSNPFLRQIAPSLYGTAQHRFERAEDAQIASDQRREDLASASAQKEADRKADQNAARAMVQGVAPQLTDDQKAMLDSAAQNGTAAVQPLIGELFKNGFRDRFVAASPDDLKGYPEGTTGQKNSTTGEIVHVYNPTGDRNSAAQVQLAQQKAQEDARHNRVSEGQGAQRLSLEQTARENQTLDPATIQQMAAQAWQGDKSVFSNLGRGTQGAANIVALRNEIARQGQSAGKSGADLAAMNAHFVGDVREQAAIGQRAGAAGFALAEVPEIAKLSSDAYAKLPRGQFMPLNRLRALADRNLSSPEQAQAVAADVALTTAYARALNPNGVPRESDIRHAEAMLNNAQSQEAHQAVVNQILNEVHAVNRGAATARGTAPAAAAPPAPKAPIPDAHVRAILSGH